MNTECNVAPAVASQPIAPTGDERTQTPLFRRFARHRRGWKPLNEQQRAGVTAFRKMVADGALTYETIACPICGHSSYKCLSEIDKYGLYQPVVICTSCGFVYNNPRLDEASSIRYYDTVYRQIYMGYEKPVDSYFQEQYDVRGVRHVAYLRDVAKVELNGALVVEIGCGSGGILYAFKQAGADVMGFDFDSRFNDYGREKYGLDLRTADYRSHHFDRPADIVVLSNVLEHLLDPVDQMTSIRNITKPDGLVFIEVPALERRRFGWSLQLAHVSYFTSDSLSHLLRRVGFEVVDIRYHETLINCIARRCEATSAAKPAQGYRDALQFLIRLERLGCLDYHKHQWYYPYTVGPIDMLMKALRNPGLAMDVLTGRRKRAR